MADTEVARAVVTIVPSMAGAQQSITEQLTSAASSAGVASAGKTAGSTFAGGLGKGLAVAGATTAAVATAAVVAGEAFVSAAGDVAAYGDNVDKMSQKLGLSYEGFQMWDYVLGQAGVDINSMQTGLKTLTNKLDDAKNGSADATAMFESLGLSMEDINSMSREEVFESVIAGFQGMADSTERAALANDLFGKSGQNLTPLFNSTVEDTEALKQAAQDLGTIMSDESVKASAGFQDAMDNMTKAASGAKNSMISEFLPGMADVMNGLAYIFSGNSDEGLEQISSGIDNVVAGLTENLPKLMEVGLGIVEALATAIMDNLPALADAAFQLIGSLAEFAIENLPKLIEVALDFLMTIADGIIENLPVIIPAVVDMVLTIVDKLTEPDMLVKLIEAALQLIVALAEGLMEALPKLLEKLPEIIANIVEGLVRAAPALLTAAGELIATLVTGVINLFPKMLTLGSDIVTAVGDGLKNAVGSAAEWGKDLIQNFIDGIKKKWEDLKQAVSNVAQTVKDFLGFSEPKEGPLSNFHTYAPDMVDLFTSGLKESKGKLTATMESVLSVPDATLPEGAGTGGAITIPVYLGDDVLDTVIVNANQRINLRSGGTA